MSDSNLDLARANYLAAVSELGCWDNVAHHEGEFDEKEVARYSNKRGNSFILALLGLDVIDDQGTLGVAAHWGAVLFFDHEKKKRPTLELIEATVVKIRRCWGEGYGASGEPQNLRLENRYTTKDDKNGFSLWEMSWSQRLDLADEALLLTARPLEEFEVSYDMIPITDGEPLGEELENQQLIELPQ